MCLRRLSTRPRGPPCLSAFLDPPGAAVGRQGGSAAPFKTRARIFRWLPPVLSYPSYARFSRRESFLLSVEFSGGIQRPARISRRGDPNNPVHGITLYTI